MKLSKSSKSQIACRIKCMCGFEILLVPDVKAMDEAIENHVAEHMETDNLTQEEAGCIRENLIIQTFGLIAQMGGLHKNISDQK